MVGTLSPHGLKEVEQFVCVLHLWHLMRPLCLLLLAFLMLSVSSAVSSWRLYCRQFARTSTGMLSHMRRIYLALLSCESCISADDSEKHMVLSINCEHQTVSETRVVVVGSENARVAARSHIASTDATHTSFVCRSRASLRYPEIMLLHGVPREMSLSKSKPFFDHAVTSFHTEIELQAQLCLTVVDTDRPDCDRHVPCQ